MYPPDLPITHLRACQRVHLPMYPSQSAMSHLHSLAQSMYIAAFLPKHVNTTCFADYVNSTSGAIRLAFGLLPLASSPVLVVGVFQGCCSLVVSARNDNVCYHRELIRRVIRSLTCQNVGMIFRTLFMLFALFTGITLYFGLSQVVPPIAILQHIG